MRKLAAEAVGTFILIFIGCGAVAVNVMTPDTPLTLVGVALVWGLVVQAMVYAVGDTSGAHINPAVTIGFWAAGRFPGLSVPGYILAQCVGALLAIGVLEAIFPGSSGRVGTQPSGGAMQSFWLEVALTFVLMFVVLGVSSGAKEKGVLAGIAVGGVITFEVLVGGPISGASMNPARSLAPAVISGRTGHLWIYLSAPPLGALIAVGVFALTRPSNPAPALPGP